MYKPVRVILASAQSDNLISKLSQKYLSVKIDLKDTCTGNADILLLTPKQIAIIEKARTLGRRKYKTIRMSRKQIEENQRYQDDLLVTRRQIVKIKKSRILGQKTARRMRRKQIQKN